METYRQQAAADRAWWKYLASTPGTSKALSLLSEVSRWEQGLMRAPPKSQVSKKMKRGAMVSRHLTDEEVRQMSEEYKQGDSVRSIALRRGCSSSKAGNLIKSHLGVQTLRRDQGADGPPLTVAIMRLVESREPMSATAVAKEVGCSVAHVKATLLRNGWEKQGAGSLCTWVKPLKGADDGRDV